MKNELYEKFAILQYLLHKKHLREHAEGGPMADTMRGQGRILAALKLRDGMSVKELSYLLGLAVSSMSEMLAKLEKGGYVTRGPSESDKRVTVVQLTKKGRDAEQRETADFKDIFSCLSEDEQKSLGNYLDRIISALQTDMGYDGEEAIARMTEANKQMAELMRQFHGGNRHGFPFGRHGFHGRHAHGSDKFNFGNKNDDEE